MNNPFEGYKGHPEFYNELMTIADIHARKNADYCGERDPLANLKLCMMMNVDPFIGCLVRIGDKFSRLCSFAQTGYLEVKDESIIDTLRDLAVYSLLAVVLFKEKKQI